MYGHNQPATIRYCSAGSGSVVFVEADKGGGVKLPFLRDSFVYFKRTNLGYLYYFCNRATGITVAYAWNETYAGSGANEMTSMFHDYFSAFRTGAEHAEIYCDGCPGQLWNRWFTF
eukprot:COSAG05_NODE_106_length_18750_cov_677.083105_1_plen_115_part_10